MKARVLLALVSVLAISAFSGLPCFAQAATPEAGVHGTGAIAVGTNAGLFDINVAKLSTGLDGGFRFTVVTPAGRQAAVIISKTVVSLTVNNGTATVLATGAYNGVVADLTVVAHDGGTAGGDTFDITASPRGPVAMPAFHAGGPVVKGDIVVFGGPPVVQGAASGNGWIAVGLLSSGVFDFQAVKVNGIVKGSIFYTEADSRTTAGARPRVQIYVPLVKTLDITGTTAVLGGPGFLNGQPADVRVTAIDNGLLGGPTSKRDEFHITAVTTRSLPQATYTAGGPLVRGDIVVKTQ